VQRRLNTIHRLAQSRADVCDEHHAVRGQLVVLVEQNRSDWHTAGFVEPPKRGTAVTCVTDFMNSGALFCAKDGGIFLLGV